MQSELNTQSYEPLQRNTQRTKHGCISACSNIRALERRFIAPFSLWQSQGSSNTPLQRRRLSPWPEHINTSPQTRAPAVPETVDFPKARSWAPSLQLHGGLESGAKTWNTRVAVPPSSWLGSAPCTLAAPHSPGMSRVLHRRDAEPAGAVCFKKCFSPNVCDFISESASGVPRRRYANNSTNCFRSEVCPFVHRQVDILIYPTQMQCNGVFQLPCTLTGFADIVCAQQSAMLRAP